MALSLLGVDAFEVHSPKEAADELFRLKKKTEMREESAYAIVFITEDLIGSLTHDDEKRLSRGALPAIIPLPTHYSLSKDDPAFASYGQTRLKRMVEKAVGSDILK
jgi:vacuolar-type H+-ATPase subunit F/Vma7